MSAERTPPDSEHRIEERHVPARPGRDVTIFSEYEHGPRAYGRISAAIKRVSWGAIFAGAVVAIVVQLLLNLLGLGIGLQTFDPATEGDSVGGFGMGQAIWTVISGLIALFIGGWVAGRLAGMPRKTDGMLHGIVTWGLTTLLTFYLLTTGVGQIMSGVTGLLGQGLDAAGSGIAAVAPDAARAIEDETGMDLREAELSDIVDEARALLRDTGDPDLQPETIEDEAEAAADEAESTAQAPTPANLEAAIRRVFERAEGTVNEADRQDLVNILTARTDMTEAEARQTVAEWEATFADLRQEADTLGARATQTAEDVSDTLGTAALIAFFTLLLGALAAGFGGAVGSPEDLPAEAVGRPEATGRHV